jgi:hypothetical protein
VAARDIWVLLLDAGPGFTGLVEEEQRGGPADAIRCFGGQAG